MRQLFACEMVALARLNGVRRIDCGTDYLQRHLHLILASTSGNDRPSGRKEVQPLGQVAEPAFPGSRLQQGVPSFQKEALRIHTVSASDETQMSALERSTSLRQRSPSRQVGSEDTSISDRQDARFGPEEVLSHNGPLSRQSSGALHGVAVHFKDVQVLLPGDEEHILIGTNELEKWRDEALRQQSRASAGGPQGARASGAEEMSTGADENTGHGGEDWFGAAKTLRLHRLWRELQILDPAATVPVLHDFFSQAVNSMSFWQTLSVVQYLFFNVLLIFLNNKILEGYGFAFPLMLTAVHFSISYLGASLAINVLRLRPRVEVTTEDRVHLVMPMAAVTCFNVVLGNLSLHYIPLPLMQAVKALAPGLTGNDFLVGSKTVCLAILLVGLWFLKISIYAVVMQRVLFKRKFSQDVYWSLTPTIGGPVLASIASIQVFPGALMAALATSIISSGTVVFAEMLLQGKSNDLDSLNTLYHMIPYSLIILAPPAIALEGVSVHDWFLSQSDTRPALICLLMSGVIAFCLNFSLFYAIQATSAVTFNVAGNLKIGLSMVIGWSLFGTPSMQPLVAFGCLTTFMGVGLYTWALVSAKRALADARRQGSPSAMDDEEVNDSMLGAAMF
eukprot:SM000200S05822  [mRNA]  locus=s200:206917:210226:+ [translate_table: standard]